MAELIDLVLLRGNHAGERQARYALVDLLTPGDFERRYNLGGRRFDRLHFPALPWFARFKVMAALTQLLLGDRGRDFFRVPVDVADRLRVFFLSVSWERRLGILEAAELWPEPLRTQLAQAAARVAPPRGIRAVQEFRPTKLVRAELIPAFECNEIGSRHSSPVFKYNATFPSSGSIDFTVPGPESPDRRQWHSDSRSDCRLQDHSAGAAPCEFIVAFGFPQRLPVAVIEPALRSPDWRKAN